MSSLTLGMHLTNAIVELGYLPVKIEVNHFFKKYEKAQTKTVGKESKIKEVFEEVTNTVKSTFEKDNTEKIDNKKVDKVAKEFGCKNLSDEDEKAAVNSEESVFKAAKVVKKANDTHELTKYAIYYMSQKDAKLVNKLNESEREYVNGIADYFKFGKIYEKSKVADLKKYDSSYKEYDSEAKFYITISGLDRLKSNEKFMKAIEYHKECIAAEKEHPEDDKPIEVETPEIVKDEEEKIIPDITVKKEIIHPISFSIDKDKPLNKPLPKFSENIDTELQEKLEKVLAPYLDGMEYRYEKNGDLVYLLIKRVDKVEESYIIDTGAIMGKGKIYILANIENDTVFVEVADINKKIIKEILKSRFFVLTPSEVQHVTKDYFKNMGIYSYIDMNNTEFLNDISMEDFFKLGKKLTFIVNKIKSYGTNVTDIPRFRFDTFESVNNFSIVSDSEVISPLALTGETSGMIIEGLRFTVTRDTVVQTYGDHKIEYEIKKYNEL